MNPTPTPTESITAPTPTPTPIESPNIHETDTEAILDGTNKLLEFLQKNKKVVSASDQVVLKEKFNEYFKSCPSVFDMAIKHYNSPNFDKTQFMQIISNMLTYIKKIQMKELTQNEASEKIGTILANKYFPK